jgi:hypothetical protein
MPRPKTDFNNFRLRVPPDTYQQIADAAETAGRSMNAEILYRLGRTFDPRWADYIAKIDAEERRYQEFLKSDLPPALKEQIADQIDEYMQTKAAKAKGRKPRR